MTMPPPSPSWPNVTRAELLALLRAALAASSLRFARQTALAWLAYFPGDLPVNLLYVRACLKDSRADQALPVLENHCLADPEDLEAQEILCRLLGSLVTQGRLASTQAAPQIIDCRASIFALGGRPEPGLPFPVWSQALRGARLALEEGDLETAESLIHQVLPIESPPALVAVTHLKVASARGFPRRAMQDLAGYYHLRFPGCLAPALFLADALLESGEPERAVELLHRAAAQDVTGQVAIRLWGAHHPYRELWAEGLEAPLEVAVPAEVAALLGRNRLPAGSGRSAANAAAKGGMVSRLHPSGSNLESLELPPNAENPDPVITPHDKPADTQPIPVSQASVLGLEESQAAPAAQAGASPILLPAVHATEKSAFGAPRTTTPHTQQPISQAHRSLGEPPPAFSIPESLRSVQAELERVAADLKRNQLARADGRFPVYVIFSTRQGLQNQYGAQILPAIEAEMKRLAAAVASRRVWDALVLWADDPASMAPFGLKPAQPGDPWSLKLVLADLDAALGRQGEMIGALLIVGGPEVVPFHHLPNPVDDADTDVPSDNPYATRDENYFVPEWPVGRLPGGAQASAQPLLQALRSMVARHTRTAQRRPWYRRWWLRLSRSLRPRRQRPAWGYTAAVWQRASLSVFRPIGEPGAMLVSPPAEVNGQPGRTVRNGSLPSARLGYFNLHGLQDSSEWYGQRDPAEPSEGPDYPVALRPQDVLSGGLAPQLVFSEACYGAHILEKDVEEALALKFLFSGAQSVAGSTCTAYGSITTPLIAADLLGHAFWKFVRAGLPTGEALRRAKIHLAREMHRRQGYLDGEDQKTLISFILYGDPLAQLSETASRAKSVLRPLQSSRSVKTVCDRAAGQSGVAGASPIPAEMLAQVKQVVEQYLPGMADAQLALNHEHAGCRGEGHTCPTSFLGAKSLPEHPPQRSVVVLSKHVPETTAVLEQAGAKGGSARIHHHYARLTFNESGQVVKMTVSR